MAHGATSRARRRAKRNGLKKATGTIGRAQLRDVAGITASAEVIDLFGDLRARALEPDTFLHTTQCSCGHSVSGHMGSDGPCTYEDGRGRCSCTGYSEAESGKAAADAALFAAGIRERTLEAIVAAGVDTSDAPPVTVYDLAMGSPAERAFYAEAMRAGHRFTSGAEWPSEADLREHGSPVYQDSRQTVCVLEDGTVAWLSAGRGWFSVVAASASQGQVADTVSAFRAEYPALFVASPDTTGLVPITFWTNSPYGPSSRLRMIEAAEWETVAGNYTEAVAAELDRLMGADFEPGKGGQLHIWQGVPGTGKTWAIRALASSWRPWAEFHYIVDPDAFFVSDTKYMVDVLLADTYQAFVEPTDPDADADVVTAQREGKWKVLILEDTGELLAADARDRYAQGVSRLLNVVDGMVGQGLRVLVLLTTNDKLEGLHPAAVRPGRCASQIVFGPLSAEESVEWLAERNDGTAGDCDTPMTLAELYAWSSEDAPVEAFAMGECACGHMASQHAEMDGEAGAGACSVAGCDCAQFQPVEAPDIPPGQAAPPRSNDETASDALGRAIVFATNAGLSIATVQSSPDGQFAMTFSVPGEATVTPNTAARVAVALPLEPGDTRPTPSGDPVAAPVVPPAAADMRWTAVLAPEDVTTDDRRRFAAGAISWRELPLTLLAQLETQEGHDGARVCGRIDSIWRDGNVIRAAGVFDDSEFGHEIARMVAEGVLRGVSVDIAIKDAQVVPEAQVNGEDLGDVTDPADEPLFDAGPSVLVVTDGVIGAVTVCSFPAFAEASIQIESALVADGSPWMWSVRQQGGWTVTGLPATEPPTDHVALIASAILESADPFVAGSTFAEALQDALGRMDTPEAVSASAFGEGRAAEAAAAFPDRPPAWWFNDPELDGPSPITITDDGRVFGHIAAWHTCHVGYQDRCVEPPVSPSGYAYLHLGETVCDDGLRVATGKITIAAGHADLALSRLDAASHYDHSGAVAADVRAGEDEHGIWIAGAVRRSVTEEQLAEIRAAPPSGDWRDVDGDLEMIAVLGVNVPGFPVVRERRAVIASVRGDGHVVSMIASGFDPPEDVEAAIAREFAGLRVVASGAFAELAARASAGR